MGKGDKKTRRGKIILGTYGVRRRRKKADKPEIKPAKVIKDKEIKDKKPVKESKEVLDITPVKETTPVAKTKTTKTGTARKAKPASKPDEVKEVKTSGKKSTGKAPKIIKGKKELKESGPEKEKKTK